MLAIVLKLHSLTRTSLAAFVTPPRRRSAMSRFILEFAVWAPFVVAFLIVAERVISNVFDRMNEFFRDRW
jgi:hypothetical protein